MSHREPRGTYLPTRSQVYFVAKLKLLSFFAVLGLAEPAWSADWPPRVERFVVNGAIKCIPVFQFSETFWKNKENIPRASLFSERVRYSIAILSQKMGMEELKMRVTKANDEFLNRVRSGDRDKAAERIVEIRDECDSYLSIASW